jgi:hypothetical protein
MAVMGLILIGITFESVRRRKLLERYAILWVVSGFAVLICAAVPVLPEKIANFFGITFIEAAGYFFSFFLVLVLFHISLAISKLRSNQEAAARRIALLQAELESLKNKKEDKKQ